MALAPRVKKLDICYTKGIYLFLAFQFWIKSSFVQDDLRIYDILPCSTMHHHLKVHKSSHEDLKSWFYINYIS